MELTPRPVPTASAPGRRRKGTLVYVAVGLVVVALGFVVYQGLSNATVFFYNADEAVAQRAETGDRRFRLQGEVVDGSIVSEGERVNFVVAYNGVEVPVEHFGDPPELFQDGIPVVLEGHWSSVEVDTFASDRILVKHSSEYVEDNPVRVEDYDEAPAGSSEVP
ncbi:MAG TPA: cytochrome c maturation protein CcmE [Acidimicrobiales bacterium]|nr:cytochrome c maturation protein CcmE [Acidimicrobiales bacterium]